jgi:hypothetical protein
MNKDIQNGQSRDTNVLDELRSHVKEISSRLERVHELLGLQSGSQQSGSSGSGSQDGVKHHRDPETELAQMRQELRAARETVAARGVRVR